MSTRARTQEPPSVGTIARQLMNTDVEYLLDVGDGWVQPFVITRAECTQGTEDCGGSLRAEYLTWVCEAIGAPRRAR